MEVKQHFTPSSPAVKATVTIRSFQHSDQKECLQIFKDGFQEYTKNIVIAVLSRSLWYVGMATIFTSLAAVLWSTWIFVVFVLIIFILLVFLYLILQISGRQYINYSMEYDLKDIEKWYMSDEGCHMWVAECCGEVIGMVGLIHNETHEPGAFELQRMYVVSHYRRMGIGRKMLMEVINHAKKQRIKMIVLTTSTTQVSAIQLYMKHGFKLVTDSSSTNVSGRSTHRPAGERLFAMLTNVICLKSSISSA